MKLTIRISTVFVWVISVWLFISGLAFAGVDDLILRNDTIQNGEIRTYTARNSVTAGPSFTVQNGGEAILTAGVGGITLKPGFHAENGSKVTVRSWYDASAPDVTDPIIFSLYPSDGQTVPNDGSPLEMVIIFGDTGSGIYSVKLFENQVDITNQATIGDPYNAYTLSYTITSPVEQTYQYSVVLEDMAGNINDIPVSFTVDNTPPVTTVSQTGGTFSGPFTVTLSCSEGATVYYSTDNYPPFADANNTISGTAPLDNISIDRSMNLQFFAVDNVGNIEAAKSETYLLGAIPDTVVNTSGIFNATQQRVELSWYAASGASAYHVYRCLSPFDVDILNQSKNGGYPPPASLRIAVNSSATTTYYDSAIASGVTYYYGVTMVDTDGTEGIISTLMPVNITSTTSEDSNPYSKAMAWLASMQNEQGYWGNKRRLRILATSQVLNAYKEMGKNDAGTHHALFYLRGHTADNNDYLARKIQTLYNYGQNVDEMVNRLIAQSYIDSNNSIAGWGVNTRLVFDAVSTALGARAADLSTRSIALTNNAYLYLKLSSFIESNILDRFSWVLKHDPSVFVSSMVYNVVDGYYTSEAPVFDSTWISDNPNPDGSFGNGTIDTCAAIMWINNLSQAKRDNAVNYLITQQKNNGSWNDDPYLTALCVEALKKSGFVAP